MLAFICPGQGSQSVGMAKDLYVTYPAAKTVLDALDEAVDFGLLQIMFEGPEEALTATENAQPALVAHSLAVAAVLGHAGIEAEVAAGHSLGEYSALAIAGVISGLDAVRLVRVRGQFMAEAGAVSGGTMAAIIGLACDKLDEIIVSVGCGVVTVANYNSADQIVISGEPAAVKSVSEKASEAGAKRVLPLNVSGAFHSELMAPAAEKLAIALDSVDFYDAAIPVYTNVDASAHTDASELKAGLIRQLTESVMWKQTTESLVSAGVDVFVECGPGKVLSKMLQRSGCECGIFSTGNVSAVEQVVVELT